MKKSRLLSIALISCAFSLCGCEFKNPFANLFNKKDETSETGEKEGGSSGGSEKGSESESIIKSLTATVENLELKLGEATSVTQYYTLKGNKTLSSKEKKVTIEASDPSVIKIVGNIMTGLKANGTTKITITSQADSTKSCSFNVLVKDIFFNRTYSEINGADDLSKELVEDGGTIQSASGISGMYIFNQKASTSFMASTKLIVNKVSDGELWPKFGMVFKQVDESEDLTTNYAIVFLDGPMNRVSEGHASWTDFGYCEILNGVFGWDSAHAYARHKEDAFIKASPIDYNQEFTLTSVVEGRKIHMFLGYGEGEEAKEVYMFTLEGYADLFGEGEGNGFIPGLFQFNSDVTFKDYSYTTDAEAIAAKMSGVTERLADYDDGDYEGTRYSEE